MERIRDEVKEYMFQSCLKATVRENKEPNPEDKGRMLACFLRMAKSYRLIEGVQNQDLKYPIMKIF